MVPAFSNMVGPRHCPPMTGEAPLCQVTQLESSQQAMATRRLWGYGKGGKWEWDRRLPEQFIQPTACSCPHLRSCREGEREGVSCGPDGLLWWAVSSLQAIGKARPHERSRRFFFDRCRGARSCIGESGGVIQSGKSCLSLFSSYLIAG